MKKHFSKNPIGKTTSLAIQDLIHAYDIWLNQKRFPTTGNRTYEITITDTTAKHERDLNFLITNKIFNRINRDYRTSKEFLNYLFVIEYPEAISRGEFISISNCNVHAHIVVNTSIPMQTLEFYCNDAFAKSIVLIKDTTTRTDKPQFINYLLKQTKYNRFFSSNSYNYKITLY
jgi:hypothetical protein